MIPTSFRYAVNENCPTNPKKVNGHIETPLTKSVRDIVNEYKEAINVYPPMNSYHEGYSVILEEEQKLWDEIKKKPSVRDKERLRKEAVQLAAMTLRFLVDLT